MYVKIDYTAGGRGIHYFDFFEWIAQREAVTPVREKEWRDGYSVCECVCVRVSERER